MMKLSASMGFSDTLKIALKGSQSVVVHLKNGEKLQGKVADVTTSFVVLAELSDREFYDALVSIADIAALEVRARDK